MAAESLAAKVVLANQKIQFTGTARSDSSIVLDYVPPLGDGEGYMPLELMLMSLAACSGATVALMIRKMGKHIAGMTVEAKGERRNEHPTMFKSILLDFRLTSDDAEALDVEKAIRLSEELYCPVWAMLKPGVRVESTYQIEPASSFAETTP